MSTAPVLERQPFIFPASQAGQVNIKLTPSEIALALQVSVDRLKLSRMDPRRKSDPGWNNAVSLELAGVLAEMAVAKFLDGWWAGAVVCGARLPDDDGGWEVKGTRHENGGLAIQPHTKNGIPVVLGIVKEPFVRIVGWIWTSDGRRREWWRTDWIKPAYCVPQSAIYGTPAELLAWRLDLLSRELGNRATAVKGFCGVGVTAGKN